MDSNTLTQRTIKLLDYSNIIKFYQWIFTIFGLNLPTSLYYGDIQPLKKYLLFVCYLFYSILQIIIAVYITYTHNILVNAAVIKHQLDSITRLLSYIHNATVVILKGSIVMNMFMKHQELVQILNLIRQLEREIIPPDTSYRGDTGKWKLFKLSGPWLIFLVTVLIYLNYFVIAPTMIISLKIIIIICIAFMQVKCIEYAVYIQMVYFFIDSVRKSLLYLKFQMEFFPRSDNQTMP